jgi:Ca2+-binding RTX toxin-like protein
MRKTILVLASVALAMVVLGGVAWAANIKCPNGGTNQYHRLNCWGTPQADTMHGTPQADSIIGKEGADTIYGRGNPRKPDALFGGAGMDKVYGQRGRDEISGQLGSDRLYGGPGSDTIGSNGRSSPNDTSDDYLHGGAGGDTLTSQGKSGVDHLYGEDGNDFILVSQRQFPPPPVVPVSKEIVDCGPGTDTVLFDEGVDVVDDTCEEQRPF